MGAMRVLEWLVGYPSRTAAALVLAVGATATGDQIGTQSAQLRAIRSDPKWRGGDYYDAADGDGPRRWHGACPQDRASHVPQC